MTTTKTLKDVLNDANPGSIESAMQKARFGDVMRQSVLVQLRKNVPAADPSQLATLKSCGLPQACRAASITRAYARAGGATLGLLSPQAFGATPTTGQIAVSPNGDIVTLGTDAWTDLDVLFQPMKGDVIQLTLSAASNAAVLPAVATTPGVALLIAATVVAGTSTGAKIIVANSNSNPSAGQACLNLACSQVLFNSGDAVTSVTLTLLLASAVDLNALLEADSAGLV